MTIDQKRLDKIKSYQATAQFKFIRELIVEVERLQQLILDTASKRLEQTFDDNDICEENPAGGHSFVPRDDNDELFYCEYCGEIES